MSNILKLVGSNIRELRKQKKLTQEELAELSGLQYSFLAGVERGERNITLQTLEKIIVGLKETPSRLFDFSKLDDNNFSKQEVLISIVNILEKHEDKEVKLFYRMIKDITETYKK